MQDQSTQMMTANIFSVHLLFNIFALILPKTNQIFHATNSSVANNTYLKQVLTPKPLWTDSMWISQGNI